MKEKKELVNESVEERISGFAERVKPILGKLFYVESVGIEVLDNGTISVSDRYGTTISYSPMMDAWVILSEMLLDFENSKETILKYFDSIVFPVAVSMSFANSKYFESIINAFEETHSTINTTTLDSDPDVVDFARSLFDSFIKQENNG